MATNMKSHFKQETLLIELPIEGEIRTLQQTLTYYSEILDEEIVVEVGFKTDLGSIPQIFQNIIPKDGKASFPFIIHDKMYREGKHPQDICDDVLKESCNVTSVWWWRRVGIREGLRIGGHVAYNNYRKNDKKEIR
ncbi:DUF1353 domain-containing protein [Sulfurimonas sp.]|uniref:DUF1353 domain-containing protein n=1 Tax=Sulfurimonas sp. TaxID=2022749 RepID=UPI0025DE8501|nr:DUF1353 domain-containing protein [Sulfurimonas sp.]